MNNSGIRQIVVGTATALVPVITFFCAGLASAQTTDQASGLLIAEGWQEVQQTCTECHSAQLITQNSGNKATWKSRILWMQGTQGLGELEPALEETILTYLAANYGQKETGRRPGLPAHLMPANPYSTSD